MEAGPNQVVCVSVSRQHATTTTTKRGRLALVVGSVSVDLSLVLPNVAAIRVDPRSREAMFARRVELRILILVVDVSRSLVVLPRCSPTSLVCCTLRCRRRDSESRESVQILLLRNVRGSRRGEVPQGAASFRVVDEFQGERRSRVLRQPQVRRDFHFITINR